VKITVAGIDRTGDYLERGGASEDDVLEIVLKAWQAEVGMGTVPVPDLTSSWEPHADQQLKVEDGPTTLLDGFVGQVVTDVGMGSDVGSRRLHTLQLLDRNNLWRGFRAYRYSRPREWDYQRIQGIVADFIPSASTTWVLTTNPYRLPPKVYNTDDLVSEVLQDAGRRRRKNLFLVGNEAHYHGPTEGEGAHWIIDYQAGLGTQAIPGTDGQRPAAEEVANRVGYYYGAPVAGQTGPNGFGSPVVLFDATNDRIEVPDSYGTTFDATTALTIIAWGRWTSTNAIRFLLMRGVSSNEWWLREAGAGTNGEIEFGLQTAGLTQLRHAGGYNDGAWHMFAGKYDGSNMYLWADGAQRNSTPKTGSVALAADGRIGIGGNPAASEFWNGYLGGVAVVTGVLSDTVLAELWNKGRGTDTSQTFRDALASMPSLKGLWMLGDRYRLRPSRPRRTKDPSDLINDYRIWLGGSSIRVFDQASINRHNAYGRLHSSLVESASDWNTASEMRDYGNRLLGQSKDERLTYQCGLGPFTAAQAAHLKVGQRILAYNLIWSIPAGATMSIIELRWSRLTDKLWWADLELEYPRLRGVTAQRTNPRRGGGLPVPIRR
jgi:surface antigen